MFCDTTSRVYRYKLYKYNLRFGFLKLVGNPTFLPYRFHISTIYEYINLHVFKSLQNKFYRRQMLVDRV